MPIRSLIVLTVIAACASAASAAPRSIVGQWRLTDGQCLPSDGALAIAPMSIAWDELVCGFDSVGRKGSTVTWRGSCMDSSSEETAATVVATERSGKLDVRINGRKDVNGLYVRCGR